MGVGWGEARDFVSALGVGAEWRRHIRKSQQRHPAEPAHLRALVGQTNDSGPVWQPDRFRPGSNILIVCRTGTAEREGWWMRRGR